MSDISVKASRERILTQSLAVCDLTDRNANASMGDLVLHAVFQYETVCWLLYKTSYLWLTAPLETSPLYMQAAT